MTFHSTHRQLQLLGAAAIAEPTPEEQPGHAESLWHRSGGLQHEWQIQDHRNTESWTGRSPEVHLTDLPVMAGTPCARSGCSLPLQPSLEPLQRWGRGINALKNSQCFPSTDWKYMHFQSWNSTTDTALVMDCLGLLDALMPPNKIKAFL